MARTSARLVLTFALLTSLPGVASAQAPADAWSATLEFGLNGASGNSSFSVLRTGGSLKRLETDQFEFEISALVRYGKNEQKVIADDRRAAVKFDYKPASVFSPFVFANASSDRIRKLDAKVNAGAGAKWTAFASPPTGVSLSLSALLDYENFRLEAGSTGQETRSVARWSGRLKVDHRFGTGATLEHVTFWQPEFGRLGDYTVEATTSVSTRLLSRLSVVLQHEYLHDSVPPPGVGPDDQKYSVVLRVAL